MGYLSQGVYSPLVSWSTQFGYTDVLENPDQTGTYTPIHTNLYNAPAIYNVWVESSALVTNPTK